MAPLVMGAVTLLFALQSAPATVSGTVRDVASGDVVAGAVVVLADVSRHTISDAQGRYVFRGVPAGPQHLTIQRVGFAGRSVHALVPSTGELELDVSLKPEPIRLDVLEVRPGIATRDVVHSDNAAAADTYISGAALRRHPLLAEPDAFQAVAGGTTVVQPEAPSGVHIRGGAADQTAYALDGIPILTPYHAGGVFSAWNPDALASIQLFASSPSALLPDALSGTIAAETRAPGSHFLAQGGITTTQLRMAVDGPIGRAGAGYLLSARFGYPAVLAPRAEGSYLRGDARDLLGKLEMTVFGGRLRLLGYENANDMGAAAVAEADDTTTTPALRSHLHGTAVRSARHGHATSRR
jgi:hypothetical protein